MTKHILPYNFNIYLKLTEIYGIGMPDANIMYQKLNYLHISARVNAPVYYLPLFCMKKLL